MLDFQPTSNWLDTFPQAWVKPLKDRNSSVATSYILKKCIVVHQIYPLPGRKAVDEEFLFISPTNAILDNQPIYRKAKIVPGSFLDHLQRSSTGNSAWANAQTIIKDKSVVAFIIAKSNYGHALLDFLPEAVSIIPHIVPMNGSIHLGSEPNSVVIRALSEIMNYSDRSPHLASLKCPAQSSYHVYRVHNLLITALNSRAEKISILRDRFIPAIPSPPHRSDGPKKILVNRAHNQRLLISATVRQELVNKGFTIVDLTKMSFFDTVWMMQSAEIVLLAVGAESSNLVFTSPSTNVFLYANSQQLSSPFYINAIADTILPISMSKISLCPLDPLSSCTDQFSMTDAPLVLKTGCF